MDERELVRHIRRTYGLGSPNVDVSVINLLSLLDIAQGEAYHAGRTLAALARDGIVVGEDGAVRWHGLTEAEIAGMRSVAGAASRYVSEVRRNSAVAFKADAWDDLCDAVSE